MWGVSIVSTTTSGFVQVYDYVDSCVPMLARMYDRRLNGYAAIGYVVEQGYPANGSVAAGP
jgi:hypothetical protein